MKEMVLTISVPKDDDHNYSPYIFHEIQLDFIFL